MLQPEQSLMVFARHSDRSDRSEADLADLAG